MKTMRDALAGLGVHAGLMTDDERSFLDEKGYLPMPGLFTEHLGAMRARLEELTEEEGEAAGQELHQSGAIRFRKDAGAQRLSDLVNKDPLFDVCFTHPRLLEAIRHVLGASFKLSSLNYRAALPGAGLQPLHVDWPRAVPAGDYYVCNSIWLLDDFTESNGATRVVPGSHRFGAMPVDAMDDPSQPHPDEIQLLGEAGTVVIFNSHTWHGGTTNHTDRPRRALHSYFCRRDQGQQIDQKAFARPETYARLGPEAQFVLDI